MKRNRIFSTLIVFILTLSLSCAAVNASVQEEKDKLSGLNEKKEQNDNEKDELESAKDDAESYIKSVDSQITNLSTSIYNTGQQLDDTKAEIKKTKKKLKKAQESIDIQYDDMKLRIQYMYENGTTQMLDLILHSSSVSDFLNKAEYITELSDYDRKMLNKMKETKQEIADAEKALENDQETLTALKEEQENDQQKLKKLSAAKKEELSSYENLLEDNEALSSTLDEEISAQEARVAAAEQESIEAARKAAEEKNRQDSKNAVSSVSSSSSHSKKSVSGYIWPLPGYTTVSSDYGYRTDPFSGDTSFHSGIDIPAPAGTPIVASASGRVEWASYSSSAGNWIGISHGSGVYTVYMHMSAMLVSEGEEVSAGQTIGLVGTTGSSTGNHLHFSVRLNGSYVSPWNYVSN